MYIVLARDISPYSIRRSKCCGLDDQYLTFGPPEIRLQRGIERILSVSEEVSNNSVLMLMFNEYSIPDTFKATLATQFIMAFFFQGTATLQTGQELTLRTCG